MKRCNTCNKPITYQKKFCSHPCYSVYRSSMKKQTPQKIINVQIPWKNLWRQYAYGIISLDYMKEIMSTEKFLSNKLKID